MPLIKITDAVRFEGCGEYGIPQLRSDMLADLEPKARLATWPGKLVEGLELPDYWVHNWRNACEKQLDFQRTVLSFYEDDYKFDQCYADPKRFLQKMLIANPLCVVTPNYSMWFEDPLALKVFATYRARWCGRYWQEHGFYVVPDVNFSCAFSLKFCCDGIPCGAPLIAMQVQTAKLTPAELAGKLRMVDACLDRLRPGKVLLYGSRRLDEFAAVIEKYAQVLPVLSQLETARKFRRIE